MSTKKGIIIALIVIGIIILLGGLLVLFGVFVALFGFGKTVDKGEVASKEIQYTCEAEVEGYEISFMLPEDYIRAEHNTFDAFYQNEYANFAVYGYYPENMNDGQTKEALYEEQNESVLAGRQNATVLTETEKITQDNIIITKTSYSAYKDGAENYYYFYLVEFQENSDIFAWVMINSSPEYARENGMVYDQMVTNVKLLPETTMSLVNEIEIEEYGMSFTLAHNFKPEDHDSFDAYYSNGSSWFGVFGYDSSDISSDVNRQEFFRTQNENNMVNKEDAMQISEVQQYEVNQVNVAKEVYSSKVDGAEVYYLFYLVEFNEVEDKFAYIMVFALPEYAKANEKHFDDMIASGKVYQETE